MRGVARLTVFGFLIFAIVFDLLIFGAILHGNNNASSFSQGPIPAQPVAEPTEYEYTDFILPSDLVEQPLLNSN